MWCIRWTSSHRSLESVNDKFPRDSFLRIDQKQIHYIHLIHQFSKCLNLNLIGCIDYASIS